jgi:hypothetical protein
VILLGCVVAWLEPLVPMKPAGFQPGANVFDHFRVTAEHQMAIVCGDLNACGLFERAVFEQISDATL